MIPRITYQPKKTHLLCMIMKLIVTLTMMTLSPGLFMITLSLIQVGRRIGKYFISNNILQRCRTLRASTSQRRWRGPGRSWWSYRGSSRGKYLSQYIHSESETNIYLVSSCCLVCCYKTMLAMMFGYYNDELCSSGYYLSAKEDSGYWKYLLCNYKTYNH